MQTLYGVDLQHSSREQRQKILADMIREELFVQRGRELDLASSDPEVRAALVNGVELEIAADAITSQPSEAKLRAYYEAHREKYASEGVMTVHDYVFPLTMAAAANAAVSALEGTTHDPSALAPLKSRESSKVGDEQFYFAAKIHLGEQLFAVARPLPDGGVSTVIEGPDGLHVLYMEKNVKPMPQDFAAARQQVLTDFRHDAIAPAAQRRRGLSAKSRQCLDRGRSEVVVLSGKYLASAESMGLIRRRMRRRAALWMVALCLAGSVAAAHTRSQSHSVWEINGSNIDLVMTIPVCRDGSHRFEPRIAVGRRGDPLPRPAGLPTGGEQALCSGAAGAVLGGDHRVSQIRLHVQVCRGRRSVDSLRRIL